MKALVVNFEDAQADWLRTKPNYSELLRKLVAFEMEPKQANQPAQPTEISEVLSALNKDEQEMLLQMTQQATEAAQAKKDYRALAEEERAYLLEMAAKQEKPPQPESLEFWQFVKWRLALAKKLNEGKLIPESSEEKTAPASADGEG
jgi:hypothetical protein